MKSILALVILLCLSLFIKAQENVIFYSNAKMYVSYKENQNEATKGDSESTTLHIVGSAKFSTNASIEQKGRTQLTGDFINVKNPDNPTLDPEVITARNLFVNKNATRTEKDGVVAFIGAGNKIQSILGEKPTPATPGGLQKKINYIDFPTIEVNLDMTKVTSEDWRKVGYLSVDTSAAIAVDYLRVIPYTNGITNRLSIKAAYENNANHRINSGHALIRQLGTGTDERTYSQVDLDLYKYDGDAVADDDGAFNNSGSAPVAHSTTFGKTLRDTEGRNYLTGFSPPYKELGADYMFYNVLTKPSATSITSWEGPIVDPFFRMQAGRGYFISMEVSHADHDHINGRWQFFSNDARNIKDTKRARGGYVFNRKVFQDHLSADAGAMSNFSRFLWDNSGNIFDANGEPVNAGYLVGGDANKPLGGTSDWYDEETKENRNRYELMENEKFNIEQTGVKVQLTEGLNFVGNPFMTPISLNCLLGLPNSGYSDDAATNYPTRSDAEDAAKFQVLPLGGVTASSTDNTADLRTKYWIINKATVRYESSDNRFYYTTAYDYISRVGGASTVEGGVALNEGGDATNTMLNPQDYVISPMQLFCLQASRDVEITLLPTLRTFGIPRFNKSLSSQNTKDVIMDNCFIIEAINEDEKVKDRTAIAFRESASTIFDAYDTSKGNTKVSEEYKEKYTGEATRSASGHANNIIYTKSSDNIDLLGHGIPPSTKELALFFTPPATTKEIKLKFHGIENVTNTVSGIWLVDRYLDNKVIEITQDMEYDFVSDPTDAKSIDENRFYLKFYNEDEDIIIENKDEPIYAYYKDATIYIKNLIEDDINSNVQIYDIQGRLIHKTKITDIHEDAAIPCKLLTIGTYIVKITGKRNQTTKFANLHN